MTDSVRTLSNPEGVHRPLGRYHHLARVKASELLFVAGQVSVDIEGNIVGGGAMAAQVPQVYKNIDNVLKSAGASFDNVVEFTTYVVGRERVQEYLDARTEIFEELFPNGDYPPNTLLVISGLVDEAIVLEIATTAALP